MASISDEKVSFSGWLPANWLTTALGGAKRCWDGRERLASGLRSSKTGGVHDAWSNEGWVLPEEIEFESSLSGERRLVGCQSDCMEKIEGKERSFGN